MADRIALYLQDSYSLRESMSLAQHAEVRGFEAVWQAESQLRRDSLIPLAAYAATTHRIRVAAGVMNIWTRNVAAMAAMLTTLDDLAPDRVMCGLGTWWDPLAREVGINRNKPLLAMREVLTNLRDLLAGRIVTYQGEFVRLDLARLDAGLARRVPLYIGATGPKLLALGGEIADGVILNHLVSPAYTEQAIEAIKAGAVLAGRTLDEVDRPQVIVCAVDEDRLVALEAARRLLTPYLAQQPQIMQASGVPQDLLDEVSRLLTAGYDEEQFERAVRLVPDDVVQMVTAAGSGAEVKAKVRDYVQHGATCPVLFPIAGDAKLLIDLFTNGYS